MKGFSCFLIWNQCQTYANFAVKRASFDFKLAALLRWMMPRFAVRSMTLYISESFASASALLVNSLKLLTAARIALA